MKVDLAFLFAALLAPTALGSKFVKEIILDSRKRAMARGATYIADPALRPDSVLDKPQDCINGKVTLGEEDFPCKEIDFLSFVAYKDMEIKERAHIYEADSADIWGFMTKDGKEVTAFTMDNGITLLDTTNPVHPCVLAKLPTGLQVDIWADCKYYSNTLYHVKDYRGEDDDTTKNYGVEVYDLSPLEGLNCSVEDYEPILMFPDYVTTEHGRSHNLVVNTETARLYAVGIRADVCNAGMVVYDISTPLVPKFIGCVDADEYTHDAQCVLYDGPDDNYFGKEICFAFNEDTLTIWDVTDMKKGAVMVSRTPYPNQVYSHQGWITRDMSKLLLDDELDEICNDDEMGAIYKRYCDYYALGNLSGYNTTSTNVFDITNLEDPILESVFMHDTTSIDHNLYVWGAIHEKGWGGNPPLEYFPDPNFAYLNNYMAGVRVLDIHGDDSTLWSEAGYFDVTPNETFIEFFGVWSGYVHPSGVYVASSIERGLFVLAPRMVFSAEFPSGPAPTPAPTAGEPLLEGGFVALIFIGLIFVVVVFGVILFKRQQRMMPSAAGSPNAEVDPGSNIQHYTSDEGAKATL